MRWLLPYSAIDEAARHALNNGSFFVQNPAGAPCDHLGLCDEELALSWFPLPQSIGPPFVLKRWPKTLLFRSRNPFDFRTKEERGSAHYELIWEISVRAGGVLSRPAFPISN